MSEKYNIDLEDAVIYLRRSKDKKDEAKGLKSQEAEIRRFARDKFKIAAVFEDDDTSGVKENRTGLKALLKFCKQRTIKKVLIYMYDRMARDVRLGLNIEADLKAIGVEIISIHEGNSGDEERDTTAKLYAYVDAQVERAKIKKRTSRGLRSNAESGLSTGGKAPLGYDYNNKKMLVVNEHEAEAIRLAFELFAAGFPKKKIADELNKKGFRTKRNNLFKVTSFDAIYNNTRYIGINKYGKMKNLPKCPAIVEKAWFDKVQERLTLSKQRTNGVRANAKTKYPLSGKVTCKLCGAKLHADKSSNTLRCPNRKKKTCTLIPINMDKLTDFIKGRIRLQITDSTNVIKENIAGIHNKLAAKEKKERETLNRGIGVVDREIETLERRLSAPDDDMAARYVRQIREKEKHKQALLNELNEISEKEKPNITDQRLNILMSAVGDALFADGVNITSKKALDAILEEVTVSNDEIVVTLNLP